MFMGFFLVRAHILKKEDAAVLSKLAIHLIMPFSILPKIILGGADIKEFVCNAKT